MENDADAAKCEHAKIVYSCDESSVQECEHGKHIFEVEIQYTTPVILRSLGRERATFSLPSSFFVTGFAHVQEGGGGMERERNNVMKSEKTVDSGNRGLSRSWSTVSAV